MTAGLSAARATSELNVLRNTAYSAVAAVYVQLHTGDPGAAGTANVSGVTTRNAITWNAPSTGGGVVSMTLASLSTWTMTGSETITHVSLWTASSAGTFLESWALSAGVPVVNNSVFSLPTFTLSKSPIAA